MPVLLGSKSATCDAEKIGVLTKIISKILRKPNASDHSGFDDQANSKRFTTSRYDTYQEVWLDDANIYEPVPCKYPNWNNQGSFKIGKIVSSYAKQTYLTDSMKSQPVFHIIFLRPATDSLLISYRTNLTLPVEVNGLHEWKVDKILSSWWDCRECSHPNLKRTCSGRVTMTLKRFFSFSWKSHKMWFWSFIVDTLSSPVLSKLIQLPKRTTRTSILGGEIAPLNWHYAFP